MVLVTVPIVVVAIASIVAIAVAVTVVVSVVAPAHEQARQAPSSQYDIVQTHRAVTKERNETALPVLTKSAESNASRNHLGKRNCMEVADSP